MHRSLLLKAAAVLLCGALAAGTLSACERKQVELDNVQIINFTAPEIGEDIVVLTVKDYGDVKIRLFPEESPTGVENFTTLVKNGYYDELIFHRVVQDFVIQSGDPKGNGTGGDDCWGTGGFVQTISPKLCHVTGAVAYATATDKLNNSQFYIVTGSEVTEDQFSFLAQQYGKTFSSSVKDLYFTWGGQPYLDNDYEIFGQVFDGLEICLEIQNVSVDSNNKPKSQVVIEKAVVEPYDGSEISWLSWQGKTLENDTSGEEG